LSPKATPLDIRIRLSEALTALVADPAVILSFNNMGLIPNTGSSEQFASFLVQERVKWADVVKAAQISLD
jgi:tripartite-type tricarboxylate transporter receptor subunit TctC